MIEVEVLPVKDVAAVLASVAIPFEYVVSGKLHLLAGQPVEEEKQNNSGNADAEGDRSDEGLRGGGLRDVLPFLKAVGLERPVLMAEDDLRMAFEEQGHRPAY